MQCPKGRGLAVYTPGMDDYVPNRVFTVLFKHQLNIFRQAEAKDPLHNKTAMNLRVESKRIDIPKEMPCLIKMLQKTGSCGGCHRIRSFTGFDKKGVKFIFSSGKI